MVYFSISSFFHNTKKTQSFVLSLLFHYFFFFKIPLDIIIYSILYNIKSQEKKMFLSLSITAYLFFAFRMIAYTSPCWDSSSGGETNGPANSNAGSSMLW